MERVRVKICCIASRAEARMAVHHGAAALGLVAEMPSGPGVIADDLIAEIAAAVPPGVATVLLTSRLEPGAIVEHVRHCRTNTVQLVAAVAPETYGLLRRALPWLKIVQVIHVTGPAALAQARAVAPLVDALLLDSGKPDLPVQQLGGTGRVHDWTLSRRIVEAIDRPVFLAGGLKAENAGRAVREVAPYGLDLCTGVRSDGRLDEAKLAAFFAAVKAAPAEQAVPSTGRRQPP